MPTREQQRIPPQWLRDSTNHTGKREDAATAKQRSSYVEEKENLSPDRGLQFLSIDCPSAFAVTSTNGAAAHTSLEFSLTPGKPPRESGEYIGPATDDIAYEKILHSPSQQVPYASSLRFDTVSHTPLNTNKVLSNSMCQQQTNANRSLVADTSSEWSLQLPASLSLNTSYGAAPAASTSEGVTESQPIRAPQRVGTEPTAGGRRNGNVNTSYNADPSFHFNGSFGDPSNTTLTSTPAAHCSATRDRFFRDNGSREATEHTQQQRQRQASLLQQLHLQLQGRRMDAFDASHTLGYADNDYSASRFEEGGDTNRCGDTGSPNLALNAADISRIEPNSRDTSLVIDTDHGAPIQSTASAISSDVVARAPGSIVATAAAPVTLTPHASSTGSDPRSKRRRRGGKAAGDKSYLSQYGMSSTAGTAMTCTTYDPTASTVFSTGITSLMNGQTGGGSAVGVADVNEFNAIYEAALRVSPQPDTTAQAPAAKTSESIDDEETRNIIDQLTRLAAETRAVSKPTAVPRTPPPTAPATVDNNSPSPNSRMGCGAFVEDEEEPVAPAAGDWRAGAIASIVKNNNAAHFERAAAKAAPWASEAARSLFADPSPATAAPTSHFSVTAQPHVFSQQDQEEQPSSQQRQSSEHTRQVHHGKSSYARPPAKATAGQVIAMGGRRIPVDKLYLLMEQDNPAPAVSGTSSPEPGSSVGRGSAPPAPPHFSTTAAIPSTRTHEGAADSNGGGCRGYVSPSVAAAINAAIHSAKPRAADSVTKPSTRPVPSGHCLTTTIVRREESAASCSARPHPGGTPGTTGSAAATPAATSHAAGPTIQNGSKVQVEVGIRGFAAPGGATPATTAAGGATEPSSRPIPASVSSRPAATGPTPAASLHVPSAVDTLKSSNEEDLVLALRLSNNRRRLSQHRRLGLQDFDVVYVRCNHATRGRTDEQLERDCHRSTAAVLGQPGAEPVTAVLGGVYLAHLYSTHNPLTAGAPLVDIGTCVAVLRRDDVRLATVSVCGCVLRPVQLDKDARTASRLHTLRCREEELQRVVRQQLLYLNLRYDLAEVHFSFDNSIAVVYCWPQSYRGGHRFRQRLHAETAANADEMGESAAVRESWLQVARAVEDMWPVKLVIKVLNSDAFQ